MSSRGEAEEQAPREVRCDFVFGCPHEVTFVLQSEHSQTLSKAGAGKPAMSSGTYTLLAYNIWWAPGVIVWQEQRASRVR